jgi:hypothetical protein
LSIFSNLPPFWESSSLADRLGGSNHPADTFRPAGIGYDEPEEATVAAVTEEQAEFFR